jgi:hypothetical protein
MDDDRLRSYELRTQDGAGFSSYRVTPLKHNFHTHPLMQLPRLAELARELSKTSQCRFIIPGSKQESKFDHTSASPDGRSIDEVFRRIEEPGSWVALYNVQTDPAYAGFLHEVTTAARALIDREQPGMFGVGGFIFISAPPSVTPFHIDRENNLWLQVRGRKVINVWDHTDRHVVPAKYVDHFIVSGGLEHVRLQDGFRERSHEFDVAAGDGVYFPSTSPHMTRTTDEWVRPGDGVSISIGVVFYTRHTYRLANIHAWNEFARRRFGVEPRSPGHSGWRDSLKFRAGRALVWALKNLRGYQPTKGMELPGDVTAAR